MKGNVYIFYNKDMNKIQIRFQYYKQDDKKDKNYNIVSNL